MFRYEELKYPELRDSLKNSISFICANRPAALQKVILFGSCARGEETVDSDIDICCVFDNSEKISSASLLKFKGFLRCVDEYDRDIVFCNQWQLTEPTQLLFKHINRDGKILLDFTTNIDK